MSEPLSKKRSAIGMGSSKPATITPNNNKWSDSIKEQAQITSPQLNAKFLPLDLVLLDPQNIRSISVTMDTIKNGPKLTAYLPYTEGNQKKFEAEVANHFKSNENAKRLIKDYTSLADLAANIGNPKDLIHPINVYMSDGYFNVNSGHRRTLAHHLLEAKHIAAIIKEPSEQPLTKCIKQYKENSAREDLSLADELRSVNKVVLLFEDDKNKVSINKLSSLLCLKRTRANWLLATHKESEKNALFKDAIATGLITSLEVAYHIASMQDQDAKMGLVNEILSGKKLTFKQLLSQAKVPSLGVRSPNTSKRNDGIKVSIKNDQDINVLSKIIRFVIKDSRFKDSQKDFDALNLTSKNGVQNAWSYLYELLSEPKFESRPRGCSDSEHPGDK